jgi:hypothetical protein
MPQHDPELMRLRIPHTSIVRPFVSRAFILWMLVRIGTALVAAFAAEVPVNELVRWTFPGAVGMLGVCALLGYFDVRVRGERALLGNLGIDDRELIALYLVPAAVGETILAVVMPW